MSSLESLGFQPFFATQFDLLKQPDLVPARIASEGRSVFHLIGCRTTLGELSGRLRHHVYRVERPVVGDWVAVADGGERAVIHHVLDRRTAMIRRAAGTNASGQVVAANVDVFFIVTSADRDFNLRRLERYLTAVWSSGADPVVVLNKIDLGGDVDEMVKGLAVIGLGVPVVRVSALTGEGMGDIHDRLGPGRTIGLVGSSGVGKSSLINRLLGRVAQETRELRKDGRGRHATSSRRLFEIPDGGMLVDTPGMRELGLIEDGGGIDAGFADIAALAEGCRFSDCRHAGEPGCAVEEAIKAGDLDVARLGSYRKLRREIAAVEQRRDPQIAGRAKRRWKTIHKTLRLRKKIDPKMMR